MPTYNAQIIFIYVMKYAFVWFHSWELIMQLAASRLMKLDETIRYCWCQNCYEVVALVAISGRYGCAIVISYTEVIKDVPQWLLPFNLCVSVTWHLTCVFHIYCTHNSKINDIHRDVCDNRNIYNLWHQNCTTSCDWYWDVDNCNAHCFQQFHQKPSDCKTHEHALIFKYVAYKRLMISQCQWQSRKS